MLNSKKMFLIYATYLLVLILEGLAENKPLNISFQQNDYVMKFERAETARINKHHVKQFDLLTYKYNRTWPVVNLTYEYNIDVGNDLEIVAQAYKFASNEYRLFPIRLQVNSCDAVNKNVLGVGAFKKCGNFTGCPMVKNRKYHYCKFAPDQLHFPPLIPSGQYMLELQGLFGNIEMFVINGYGTISRPIPHDKK